MSLRDTEAVKQLHSLSRALSRVQPSRRLVTKREAARRMKISPKRLQELIDVGLIDTTGSKRQERVFL